MKINAFKPVKLQIVSSVGKKSILRIFNLILIFSHAYVTCGITRE
jgi:hypothetical protein